MNDFAHTTDTPTFDTAAIARGARRKRATAIAGIATALIVGGAGTALAVGGAVGSSSHASKPAASAVTSTDDTTFLVRTSDGSIAKESLHGASSLRAREMLVHFRLTPNFTRVRKADCPQPQDAVISLSPHAPTVLNEGDTVLVTTCFR